MNIAVYLGSQMGNSPIYQKTAEETGKWFGAHHHTLVYGGSCVGTMNVLARNAHNSLAKVIGVMPRFMVEKERNADYLDMLYVTETMAERREKMMELAEGFIALPGGPGTLDEVSEVISNMRLGLLDAYVVILNVNGYYDALEKQFEHMIQEGFYSEEEMKKIFFVNDVSKLDDVFVGGDE